MNDITATGKQQLQTELRVKRFDRGNQKLWKEKKYRHHNPTVITFLKDNACELHQNGASKCSFL